MIKRVALFCGILLLVLSCKTISVNHTSQTITTQQLTLGSIGADKQFILQEEFKNAAIPKYKDPIKISVNVIPFSKQSHKAFLKAKALQSASVDVNYIDSLNIKPKFIQLQIADKVGVINSLNSFNNSDVKQYLSFNKYANILTNISLALDDRNLESIINADAVFLFELVNKTYALQLQKEGQKPQTIKFTEGIVFAYKTSHCCWQENSKRQLNIVDFVQEFNDCPNGTYRSANRAKKKINYFKL